MTSYTRVSEQALIDRGSILTREDAHIWQRIVPKVRIHYRYSDRIDAALMALADAKTELKREVARFIRDYR